MNKYIYNLHKHNFPCLQTQAFTFCTKNETIVNENMQHWPNYGKNETLCPADIQQDSDADGCYSIGTVHKFLTRNMSSIQPCIHMYM